MQKPDSNYSAASTWGGVGGFCICLLLAAAGIALFWPVVGYDFIALDDAVYFAENEHVLAGLTWHNLAWAFQSTLDASWYPLSWLSFMLDAELFGRGSAGPHLTNMLLHVANGILLFLLWERLTGSLWRSALVAALFVLHPLHVESVAWVSERKDVLSTCFGLLAMIAYVSYAQGRGQKSEIRNPKPEGAAWAAVPVSAFDVGCSMFGVRVPSSIFYLLSLGFFALGLLSKPMLVTLPFVMLLLDYWPMKRMQNAECRMQKPEAPDTPHVSRFTFHVSRLPFHVPLPLFLEKVPFLLLAMIVSAVTVVVHKQEGAIAPLASVSMSARFANAFVSYARYLGQTFWPTDLAIPYLHPRHWPLGPVCLGVALVVGLSAISLWLGRRRPYLPVGWFWFLGTLVPVIGLIQWGNQAMADRFLYVPSVGLFVALAWGLGDVLGRWRLPKSAVASAAALVLLALALRSRDQLRYWRNSEALFQHTIEVTTGNYVAYDCLGSALARQGRHDEALRMFSESVRLQPRYSEGQYDLGTTLLKRGRLDEAVEHLAAAVKNNPAFAHACINLGKALLEQGKPDEAAVHLAQAVRLTPDDPEAQYNLGTVLVMQAKPDAAIACFSEALRLNPNYGDAHGNLGVTLMRQGKPDPGVAHLAAAVKLKPDDPQLHCNLGLALLELNRPREAADQFSQALRLNPDSAATHYHLALALVRQDKPQEALLHVQKARELASKASPHPDALQKQIEELKQKLDARPPAATWPSFKVPKRLFCGA